MTGPNNKWPGVRGPSRRTLMIDSVAAASGLTAAPEAKDVNRPVIRLSIGVRSVNTIRTRDGTEIYYKDWGKGPPVVLSRGWPLNADVRDDRMMFMITGDLKRFDVPTLIIHGEDDQNVPIANTALLSAKLIRKAALKVYPGAPRGLTVTRKYKFNDDLLRFVQSLPAAESLP